MAEPQTSNEHIEEDASELIFPKGKSYPMNMKYSPSVFFCKLMTLINKYSVFQ